VWIKDHRTGWEPTEIKIERKPKRPPRAAARKREPKERNHPALARQEENAGTDASCWKKSTETQTWL